MRRLALALLLLPFSSPVLAQTDPSIRYVSAPDLATAHALSAAAWAAVKCDPVAMPGNCNPAHATKYVYPVIGLTDGTYAVVIRLGDVYAGEHISLPNGKKFDLTAGQIAALSTRAQMGTKLGDVLQIALVNSRVTAPELTAIGVYNNAHPSAKTNWNLLISTAIDLQGTLVWTVMGELQAAGVLSAARVQAITAPNPAAAVVTD
jgi:hypothetical protein